MTLMVKCDKCGSMTDIRYCHLTMALSAEVTRTVPCNLPYIDEHEKSVTRWTHQAHLCRSCADEFLATIDVSIYWDDEVMA